MTCCDDEVIKWVMSRRWYPLKGVMPDEVATISLGANLRGLLIKMGSRQVFTPLAIRDSGYV
ncbi:MAG: hypothetical protein QXE63_03505, partial [Zestosphaera sp.]